MRRRLIRWLLAGAGISAMLSLAWLLAVGEGANHAEFLLMALPQAERVRIQGRYRPDATEGTANCDLTLSGSAEIAPFAALLPAQGTRVDYGASWVALRGGLDDTSGRLTIEVESLGRQMRAEIVGDRIVARGHAVVRVGEFRLAQLAALIQATSQAQAAQSPTTAGT